MIFFILFSITYVFVLSYRFMSDKHFLVSFNSKLVKLEHDKKFSRTPTSFNRNEGFDITIDTLTINKELYCDKDKSDDEINLRIKKIANSDNRIGKTSCVEVS